MNFIRYLGRATSVLLAGLALASAGCEMPKAPSRSSVTVPAQYAGKHMPADWWTDSSIIDEGRQLYLGLKKRDVNCAKCHGRNGKPVAGSARDFRDSTSMKKYSDSHLFWRVSEGLPYTRMKGYKGELSEAEIWKVIAFTSTFGLKGLKYDPISKNWVPVGTAPSGEEDLQAQAMDRAQ